MDTTTITQGQPSADGTVINNYNPENGAPLAPGQTVMVPPTGPGIVTTDPIHDQAQNDSTTLDGYLGIQNAAPTNGPVVGAGTANNGTATTPDIANPNYSDAYTQALQGLANNSNESTKRLIATIQAQHQNEVNKINENYGAYTRGLELLGIQSGQAQGTPELLKGQLLQIKNQQMAKINDLNQKEIIAMADAEEARANNEFKILNEKINYIRQLRADKAQALRDAAATDSDYMKKAEFFGDAIYEQIKGLDAAHKASVLSALALQTGIPEQYLVAAAATTAQARYKAATGTSSTTSKLGKPALTDVFSFPPKESMEVWEKEFADAGLTDETFGAITRLVNNEGYSLKQLAQSGAITPEQYDYLSQYIIERGSTASSDGL